MSRSDSVISLSQDTNKDYQRLLTSIADNLMTMAPSQFIKKDVLDLERILNELYATSYMDAWPLEIQKAILKALSRASEITYLIEHGGDKMIDRNFFETLKQFGPILYMISAHLNILKSE
jgi:hypothetical protein